ncbi:MAG: protein kinase [Gemmatimonadaceae bacterium]
MAFALNHKQLERLRDVFEEALSVPSDRRNAFIRDASDGDELLQNELLSLIEAHDASEGYFEQLSEELIVPALLATEIDAGDDAPPSGLALSRYEVIERIGGGGMGVVFKARDTQLGRTVALKFLPRRHASNPGARAQLIAEARAASRLDHPNIGVVYEIGEAADGRQFIAMAWYDGETLKERIRRGPVTEAEAIAIALQLGDALAEAHRDGIIHRDVKPANVMITRSGGVKLVDFGIAQLISEDDTPQSGAAGTRAYMSPEQTENIPLDARTDVWSLGVLLYETVIGHRPFRGDSDEQLTSAIRNEKQQPLMSLRTDIDPQLARVVERCLQKDRSVRFQTAVEFCDALRLPEPAASPWREYRKAAAVAAFLTLFVAAALTWPYGRSAYLNRAAMLAPVRSVAVLPFTLAAASDSSAYQGDAIAEDFRTELGHIRPIIVPSYLSSASYEGSAKPVTEIAKEMGANYVVTASVTRSADGPALDLHLIDGKTGTDRLVRQYFANGGRVDFVREAIRDIVSSLAIPLTMRQADQLNHDRTSNALAYNLYLRGLSAEISGIPRTTFGITSLKSIRSAQGFYVQARTLDGGLAAARARLAGSHILSAISYDTTRARLEQARIEAETALRLDPYFSETHTALSGYWTRIGDEGQSIEELKRGLESAPNNVGLHFALAQRYLEVGRREESIAESERAISLDPRNPVAAAVAPFAYASLRRNAEAMKAFNYFIEISPNDNEMKLIKGHFFLRWKGSPDTLLAELQRLPAGWDDCGMATFARYTALRIKRRYRHTLAMLDSSMALLSRDRVVYYPTSLMRAEMHYSLGEFQQSAIYYEHARSDIADSVAVHPNDPAIHAALARADAGLGRRSEAIAEAQRAMDLSRVKNAAHIPQIPAAMMAAAVEVFGSVGQLDRAFETLELLLAIPSRRDATLPFLQAWPGFDPLRNDARFKQLIQTFGVR